MAAAIIRLTSPVRQYLHRQHPREGAGARRYDTNVRRDAGSAARFGTLAPSWRFDALSPTRSTICRYPRRSTGRSWPTTTRNPGMSLAVRIPTPLCC